MRSENHYRLGLFRRNRRNYSLHLRKFGKSSLDRLVENRLISVKKALSVAVIIFVNYECESEVLETMLLAYLHVTLQLNSINSPYLGFVDIIPRETISCQSFTDQNLQSLIGFTAADVNDMMLRLDVPDKFTLNRGRCHTFFVVVAILTLLFVI